MPNVRIVCPSAQFVIHLGEEQLFSLRRNTLRLPVKVVSCPFPLYFYSWKMKLEADINLACFCDLKARST